jgi:hypothetical protein
MRSITSHRSVGIFPLLLLVLAGCAGQLFAAASCHDPVVGFQAGQLTIASQGCSLQQVLTAVGRQTGIETQVPASASAVPVFANLGPGDPRQVVSALLDGAPFNWSLAIKGDEFSRLVGVVLAERIAPLKPEKPPVAAVQVAATLAANATYNRKPLVGQAPPDNNREMAREITGNATSEAALQHQPSDQPRRRAEIDDATLSKLPPLPTGVPTGIWALFPDVVANIVANGGPAQSSFPSSAPASNPAEPPPNSARNPALGSKGCSSCPIPPGVDPRVVNLYPSNLMQLIGMPPTPPNIQQGQPPPWLRH